jgi:hypothetical protein
MEKLFKWESEWISSLHVEGLHLSVFTATSVTNRLLVNVLDNINKWNRCKGVSSEAVVGSLPASIWREYWGLDRKRKVTWKTSKKFYLDFGDRFIYSITIYTVATNWLLGMKVGSWWYAFGILFGWFLAQMNIWQVVAKRRKVGVLQNRRKAASLWEASHENSVLSAMVHVWCTILLKV